MMVAKSAVGGVLAMATGASFALIGAAYKMGERRGLSAMQVSFVLSALATIAFGGVVLWSGTAWPPAHIWIAAAFAGGTQYVALRMIQRAMRMGPMSALWSAASLSFVPVVPYAWMVFGRKPGAWQWVGLLAAAGCVVVAARWLSRAGSADTAATPRARLNAGYLVVLVLVMLFNGGSSVAILDLSLRPWADEKTYAEGFMPVYTLIFYGLLATLYGTDLAVRRRLILSRTTLRLGALAAAGSCIGIVLAFPAGAMLGALSWAVIGSAGIVAMALIDTFSFGERRTSAWYATCLLGVLAVVLSCLS